VPAALAETLFQIITIKSAIAKRAIAKTLDACSPEELISMLTRVCKSSLQSRITFGNLSSYLVAGVFLRCDSAATQIEIDIEASLIILARAAPVLTCFPG